MEHKIFSEYDRVHVENIFPAHRRRAAELDPDDGIEPPRSWLPRRALAVAAFLVVLTTLAAGLWPETLNTVMHRNRDISQIGVPIGVPEDASATNAASVAPAVTHAVAPDSSPAEVVANDQRSESELSGQGVDDSKATATDSPSEQTTGTQNEISGTERSPRGAGADSAAAEMNAVRKPIAPTIRHRSSSVSGRPRVVRAQPYEFDDRMPPLHPGSVRARVVGRNPYGALIVALPSGETVIVETPRRRMRPIPIERRERFSPPFQPFDPTLPPVD